MTSVADPISAGEVATGPDDWNEMIKITNSGLITGSPVNTTATFYGDTLFCQAFCGGDRKDPHPDRSPRRIPEGFRDAQRSG